jgi:histone deacetylase complex regulatory component SIN3
MQKLDESVLNFEWVSVPTGSEHFSFHNKNFNEEQLFKVEDERYEHDQLISITKSIITTLTNIQKFLQNNFRDRRVSFLDYKHLIKAYQLGWILHSYEADKKN